MRNIRTYQDFQRQLADRQLGAGYIFAGRESFLIDEAITALRDALLTHDFTTSDFLPRAGDQVIVDSILARALTLPQGLKAVLAENDEQETKLADARRGIEGFDYGAFQGKEANVDDILMQVRTAPFMGRQRLVIVKEFDRYRKEPQQRLLEELKRESKFCRMVLTFAGEDWTVEKAIAAQGCSKYVVAMPDAGFEEVQAFVNRWAAANKVKFTDDARLLLIDSTGGSLGQIKAELDKIKTYLGRGVQVTKETVRDLTGVWREYQINEFADAVARRNRTLALNNLWRLNDWNEEPIKIVGWLAGRFLRMLAYGYGDARSWTRTELVNALKHLSVIDLRLKRGFPERYYLLESFVIRRTAPARKTA